MQINSIKNKWSEVKWREVREIASDLVAIGFGFESDLLGKKREFSGWIVERIKAKLKWTRITLTLNWK